MSAYVITGANGSTVYFADSAEDAFEEWKDVVGACGDCSLNGCGCECYNVELKREPFFDRYEGKGAIPLDAYRDAGWMWTCDACVDEDMSALDHPCGTGDWTVINGRPFCHEHARQLNTR